MLFINPASEQFGGILSRYVPVGVPVALGTLAAYLMKFGHQVRVVDDELGKVDAGNIDAHTEGLPRPLVFGISVLTVQAARAYEIVRMLKAKYPDCLVVLGGIHVTAMPEEGIRKGADVVVRGEGEIPLRALYEAFRNGEDWSKVRGLTYRGGDGRIYHTEEASIIDDIDEIPMFPYEMFEHSKYDMGFITSARGCPYKCTYCSQRLMTGLTYRYKSPARVVQELELLVDKYGQKHVIFYDDNFSVNRGRVIALCDAIKAAKLHERAKFFIQTRADNFYEDILPHMKSAGFDSVGFGMETGVERLAEHIVKGQTVETHMKGIELARKYGIKVSVFMIFGLPTETHEDRMYSYKMIQSLGLMFTKFNNLIPYPGTTMYNEVKESGRLCITKDWSNFNSTLTATRTIFDTTPLPYLPEGTSEWELKRDTFRCNMSYYFSFRMILNVLRREEGPGFVMLPPQWYLKPREILEMLKLGIVLGANLLLTLLPKSVGGAIYHAVTGVARRLRPIEMHRDDNEAPEALDGTMRTIVFDKYRNKKNIETVVPMSSETVIV